MGMRIFATLAFILATVVLCFGLVLLNDGMLEMQNEIHEFSKAANVSKLENCPKTAAHLVYHKSCYHHQQQQQRGLFTFLSDENVSFSLSRARALSVSHSFCRT
mmetsp:Transcript_2604/g.6189  ORF Transcript_2604/g.6189 Transcript_2604/m.6189 type:complete len:104 (-) Transcript_2604:881-1192(-)